MKEKRHVLYLIARIGGWDGISFQSKLWIKLLLSLNKRVTLATGKLDKSAGPLDVYPFSRTKKVLINDISLESQSWLYKNAFRSSYNRREWLKRFVKKKDSIKKQMEKLIEKSDIIIAHNFSIKYLVPAAWAALYELASEYSDRRFISIDADSPYERGFMISDLDPEVLWMIGNPEIWKNKTEQEIDKTLSVLKGRKLHALPGPVPLLNVLHVSFNNYQSRVNREIYGINPANLIEISDMGEFRGPKSVRKMTDRDFMRLVSLGQVTNPRGRVSKRDIFIVSPVRPIYRKNLKYVAYLADQFRLYLKEERGVERNVFLIITHPSTEEDSYWQELQEDAGSLGITLVHLGDRLKLRRKGKQDILYEEFLWALSRMRSISVIGSSVGAWENGIVESTESKIPVSVNPLLPAYQDMVMIGFQYIPCPITRASLMIERGLGGRAWINDASIERFFESLYRIIFDKRWRKNIVEHNFRTGRSNMSLEVVRPVIEKILN